MMLKMNDRLGVDERMLIDATGPRTSRDSDILYEGECVDDD